MKSKTTIGLFFGGRSSEHQVSVASARSVCQYIDNTKYDVIPIFISPSGHWLISHRFRSEPEIDSAYEVNYRYSLLLSPDYAQPTVLRCPELQEELEIDIFFPLLHGSFGEDGTIQGLMDLVGAPYVGAEVAASSLSMDKGLMKSIFKAQGLPILPYRTVKRVDWERNKSDILTSLAKELEYPLFTKPASLGSSIGISKVSSVDQMEAAIDLAAKYDRKIIVEQGIDCREVECAILGNDEPLVSVVGEIIPKRPFYDYQAKYVEGLTDFIIPAKLEENIFEEVRFLAREAFLAVDAAGMARVDFFIRRGNNKVFINEINTIPGFTAQSMYPKLWEASGINYPELIDQLIELAWQRHEDKARNVTKYEL